MNLRSIRTALIAAVLLCSHRGGLAEWEPHSLVYAEPYEFTPLLSLRDHLEIGARIHHFNLKDTLRSGRNGPANSNIRINFIGSVWGLQENQDYFPRLYAQYALVPFFGIGATYDHVAAKTLDWGNLEKTEIAGDGDVTIYGPLFYLFARYPNSTRFLPFAELGWAYYFANFEETAQWAATAPGYRFEVDDTSGYFLALGVDFALHEKWHANLYWRRMFQAEVNARAYFTPGPRVGRYGAFPMEYEMLGLGVSYRF